MSAGLSLDAALRLLAAEMTDSDCVDETDRLEFERRNLGRNDIRAASMLDEGVNESNGDMVELREPVAKETFD